MNCQRKGKQRIEWLDIARGIAMVLVIYGHCDGSSLFRKYIYIFHVPLFFFVSGYLYSGRKSVKQFVKDRIRRLLIPFLLFGLTAILAQWGYSVLSGGSYDGFHYIKCMLLQIRGTESRLWFLPCLFLAEMMLTVGMRIPRMDIKTLYFIMLIALGWLNTLVWKVNIPWYPDTSAIAVSLMLAGYYARKHSIFEKHPPGISAIIGGTLSGAVFLADLYFGRNTDMIQNIYGNPVAFYAGALSGIVLVISASRMIHSKLLSFIGKNTIIFLCLNTVGLRMSWFVWGRVRQILPNYSQGVMDYCVVTFFAIAILIPVSMIINRYFPMLCGEHRKKRKEELEK